MAKSNPQELARRRGKRFEQAVARALGGTRPPGGNRGIAASDIDGVPWSIECTRTRNVGARLNHKWQQAVRNAKREGKEPVLVAARERQRVKDALVCIRFELFCELARRQP